MQDILPTGALSSGFGAVSPNGLLAVVTYSGQGGQIHYALWTSEAGTIPIAPNIYNPDIFLVNNVGEVAGTYYNGTTTNEMFTWTASGGFEDLGGEYQPAALSDNGEMVGTDLNSTVQVDGYSTEQMFVYTPQSGIQDIPNPEGVIQAVPVRYGLNNADDATGDFMIASQPLGEDGFFWSPSSGYVDLGAVPGSATGEFTVSGWAINSSGEVVGTANTNWHGGFSLPFVWTQTSGITLLPLGTLRGSGSESFINDNGWVAGIEGYPTTLGAVGTVWIPTGSSPSTIAVTVAGSQTYGSSSPTFIPTYTAPAGVTLSGTLTCTTVNGGTAISPSLSAAGSYTVDGSSCSGLSVSDPTDYTLSYTGGAFTVSPSTIPVTVTGSQTYGSSSPSFTPAYSAPSGVTLSGTLVCTTVNDGTPIVPSLAASGSYTVDGLSCSGLSVSDPTDYTLSYVGGAFAVNQATPVITWLTPAPITYGTPLSATQLDATANVPGTFVYSPPAGTVLPIGANQTLSVTFTPADSTDYTTVSDTTTITVNQPAGWTVVSVVDSNANPLSGVPIKFTSASGVVTNLTTGPAGTASAALAPGKYTVTATYANGYQNQSLTVTANGPNMVNIATVAVTVQVNDPSSADIAAASVAQAGNTGTFGPKTAVNSNGQVVFQALPGTSSFTAYVAGGYQTQTVTVPSVGPFTVSFSTVPVTVQVNDPTSSDMAAASVAHAGNTGTFGSKTPVTPNPSGGQVVFQALPGTSSFTAYVAGGYQTLALTVTSAGPNTVTFSTVAVTVTVTKNGNALPTADVAHAGNTGTFGPKTPVNSSGQVVFQALPGNSYFTAWDGSISSPTATVSVPGTTSVPISVA